MYINVIEQNAGWGAEWFVNKALRQRGHETYTIDYRARRDTLADALLQVTADFDVMLLQRGDGFPLDLIRSVHRPRFFWASELVERNRDQDVLLASGLFSHIFVRTKRCAEIICRNGWISPSDVSVLLSGFDSSDFYTHSFQEKDIDVLFIGHISPRRRAWLNRLSMRFKVVEAKAFGADANKLFARAKIVLNIHYEEFADTETRVFEVLGSGAFLLTERLSPENPFLSGCHLIEVSDVEEMCDMVHFYLSDSVARNKIAQMGRDAAWLGHSYERRADQLIEVFTHEPSKFSVPAVNAGSVRSFARKHAFIKFLRRTKSRLIQG